MQFTKDSFYMELRQRLAALNPQRTVTLNGSVRPAIIVPENEVVTAAEPLAECFHLYWGSAKVIKRQSGGAAPMMALECAIAYRSAGSNDASTDRGRRLAALDEELLTISRPYSAPKRDYAQSPSTDLGTSIYWNDPELGQIDVLGDQPPSTWRRSRNGQGSRLLRVVNLTIFFFPEVS
jgi:hypothetical protein